MSKSGTVYMKGVVAGTIREIEDGYLFTYDKQYLMQGDACPVSLTIPLSEESYTSKVLFPFFDGLIPEGWLLDVAVENWKIDSRDRMGLLMSCCKECIGAVSVVPELEGDV